MLLYFIFIAAGLSVVVGFLVSRRRSETSVTKRWLRGIASAAATFLGCWVLLVGAFLFFLFEPWPLSLRQGPDTDYAFDCLREHLNLTAEAATSVYCRKEWGFGGDTVYSIRFRFAEANQFDRILDERQMVRFSVKDGKPRYISGPGWWPSETEMRKLELPFTRGGTEYLWIDFKSSTAFYQMAGF